MKKPKMGTPMMGVAVGAALVAIAALIMIIGFWKVLILLILFGIGYFIGTVENKQEFIKEAANRIIRLMQKQLTIKKTENKTHVKNNRAFSRNADDLRESIRRSGRRGNAEDGL